MNNHKTDAPSTEERHKFIESGETPDRPHSAAQILTLAGIRGSPFKEPYPIQRPGGSIIHGNAAELRGFYHRADGSDRWKPDWSRFGHPRNGKTHRGLDLYAPVGTPVAAIQSGYAMLYPNPTLGDELGIKVGLTITGSDGKKYDVLYGHLSALEGTSRSVKIGDVIGYTGCTGNAEDGTCVSPNVCNGYSSHLHIAVRESTSGAAYLDPAALFGWRCFYSDDLRDVPCSQAFPPSFATEGFDAVETFECEVIADNGAGLPLKLEVDQATGDARLSIGAQTCIATQAGRYEEHGSLGGLRGLVNVIVDQIHVFFSIDFSERLTVVAVSANYGQQKDYSMSADEWIRLKTWIGHLRPSELGATVHVRAGK